jgi:hypothetical protein
MSSRRKSAKEPVEILMPIEEMEEQEAGSADDHNPRTNPAMRDGNSSHGSPSETAIDEPTTDNDAGDAESLMVLQGGTPAGKRSARGHLRMKG